MGAVRAVNSLAALVLFFIIGTVICAFVLPITYSWTVSCPTCHGSQMVTCRTCGGSGICFVCGGDGESVLGWCGACQGTGKCPTCDGSKLQECTTCRGAGVLQYWKFTSVGATFTISALSVLLFMGSFAFSYAVADFYLGFNEWIYEVDNMNLWFNPSFLVWLFAKDRKRWVKWSIGDSLFGSLFIVILLFASTTTQVAAPDTIIYGSVASIAIASLFAFIFHKAYISEPERTSPDTIPINTENID